MASIDKIKKHFEDFVDATEDARSAAEKRRDYRDLKQWTGEEKQKLSARDQAAIVFAQYSKKADAITGREVQRRTEALYQAYFSPAAPHLLPKRHPLSLSLILAMGRLHFFHLSIRTIMETSCLPVSYQLLSALNLAVIPTTSTSDQEAWCRSRS